MEAAIKGCSVHKVIWICYVCTPKRGWLDKDCGVLWAFTAELGHLLLIWIALIPGHKGVKQCRGQEESVGSLFQLCEYWAHVISCIRTNPSIFFIACPLALLTLKCAGVQCWPHEPLLINGQLSSMSYASFQRNNIIEHHHRCHLHSLVPGTFWTGTWQLLDVV